MKNQWRVIIGLILVVIVVLFAVLNNQSVPVSFGFVEIKGPLILIIIGFTIVGALIGIVTSTATIWNQKKEIKELKKETEIYKQESDQLVEQALEKAQREYENQLAELKSKYEDPSGYGENATDSLTEEPASIDTPEEEHHSI